MGHGALAQAGLHIGVGFVDQDARRMQAPRRFQKVEIGVHVARAAQDGGVILHLSGHEDDLPIPGQVRQGGVAGEVVLGDAFAGQGGRSAARPASAAFGIEPRGLGDQTFEAAGGVGS
jgi:hypothetical protein